MHFQFDYFCSVETHDITFCCRPVKFTENTRLLVVFSIQSLTRFVTSFLWFQNSFDQAVSLNKCYWQINKDALLFSRVSS